MHHSRTRAWLVIFSILMGITVACGGMMVQNPRQGNSSPPHTAGLAHATIVINSAGDITEANGVWNVGAAGTQVDPFIIANWTINATGTQGILIDISYCFTIRNCTIYGAGGLDKYGIKIVYSFLPCRIENCTIYNTGGIYVYAGANYTITGNVLHDNTNGIRIEMNNKNIISGNQILSSGNAIYLAQCNDATVSGNWITGNVGGVVLYESNRTSITGNTIFENSGKGVYVSGYCTGNDIAYNTCSNNGEWGVYLEWSGNIVHHNSITFSAQGGCVHEDDIYQDDISNDIHDNPCDPPICCYGGAPALQEWYFTNGNVSIYEQVDRFQFSGCDYSFYLGVTFKYIDRIHEEIVVHGFVFAKTRNFMSNMASQLYYDLVITYLGAVREGDGMAADRSAFWMGSTQDSHIEIYTFPLCYFVLDRNIKAEPFNITLNYQLTSSYYNRQGTWEAGTMVPVARGGDTGGDPLDPIVAVWMMVIILGSFFGVRVAMAHSNKKRKESPASPQGAPVHKRAPPAGIRPNTMDQSQTKGAHGPSVTTPANTTGSPTTPPPSISDKDAIGTWISRERMLSFARGDPIPSWDELSNRLGTKTGLRLTARDLRDLYAAWAKANGIRYED